MFIFCVGDKEFYANIVSAIAQGYHVGSDDINDVVCIGLRFCEIKEQT